MTATYDPIATTTTTAFQTNIISFSGIPQTFTDLVLVVSMLRTDGLGSCQIRFNDDGNNSLYSTTNIIGNGVSASSGRQTNVAEINFDGNGGVVVASATIPLFGTAHIFSYANPNINKTVLTTASGDRNGSGGVASAVSLRRSTAAVESIQIRGSLGAGTTATLYGIKAE